MKNKKKILKWGIGVIGVILILHWYNMNYGSSWEEIIHLQDFQIEDTIIYEVSNTLILFNKDDAKLELIKQIKEIGYEDYQDKYLLSHLDSISEKFKLDSDGQFDTRIDTISLGDFKLISGNSNIIEADWKIDTTRLVRDYEDSRNYYFNSMHRIAANLLYQKKASLIDKLSDEQIKSVILKHEKWGIGNYRAYFEFEDGRYLISKESIWGL